MQLIADVVWPALLLEGRILTWWAILAGLIVEFFFLLRITNLHPWRALLADLAMNLASTLMGVFLIPLAGLLWEFVPGTIIYPVFDIGTFNPFTWTATLVMASIINAVVERLVLGGVFKQPVRKRAFWLLTAANAVSVALALASVIHSPPEL
jgi:hypothetical protein